MATKLIVDSDQISELPDPILHSILSFLPVKDAARTSILSKRWCNIWESLPYLDFGSSFLKNVEYLSGHQKKRQLKNNKISLKIADRIILKRVAHNVPIERIRIHYPWQKRSKRKKQSGKPLLPKLEKWMSFVATRSLRELYLSNFSVRPVLPSSILSAKSLRVLYLKGFRLSFRDIKFSSLWKLELSSVWLDDDFMRNLFKGCPLLEDFSLDGCSEVKSIHVTGLLNLKRLSLSHVFELSRVEVDAPELEFLCVRSPHAYCCLNVRNCSCIRSLSLGGVFLNDKCFDQLVSQCVFLEELSIDLASKLENFKILSGSLKTLRVIACEKLREVEIVSPALEYFYFLAESLANVSMNASNMVEVDLDFSFLNVGHGHGELAKFLGYFNHCRTVRMTGRKSKVFIPKDRRVNLLSPLCFTRNLVINLLEIVASELELVEYMLWLSPRAETLSINGRINSKWRRSITYSLLKFFYDEQQKDEGRDLSCPGCRLLSTRWCWQHCLREVSIEKFIRFQDHKTNMIAWFIEHVKDLKIVDKSVRPNPIENASSLFYDGLYIYYDELFINLFDDGLYIYYDELFT